MGRASSTPIFDRVAQKCLDWNVPDDVTTDLLAELIEALRDDDWDVLAEAIDRWRNSDAIIAAFRKAAPDWLDPDA